MSVLDKLASSLGRRDEIPNQQLAADIVKRGDRKAVVKLVDALDHKSKAIQGDVIKVLYEIGEKKPGPIAEHCGRFVPMLQSRHGRLVWGAMIALDYIAAVDPKQVAKSLDKIMAAANGDSVIARDHAVGILVKLCAVKPHAAKCVPLLLEQLATCPNNQFPMYVDVSLDVLRLAAPDKLKATIEKRLPKLEKASQKTRVQRALKKL